MPGCGRVTFALIMAPFVMVSLVAARTAGAQRTPGPGAPSAISIAPRDSGQLTGTLSGMLREERSHRIVTSGIVYIRSTGSLVHVDSNGRYTLTGLPASTDSDNTLTVSARSLGYYTESRGIVMRPDGHDSLDFFMRPNGWRERFVTRDSSATRSEESSESPPPFSAATEAVLDSTLRRFVELQHIPSLSVAVARKGVIQWTHAYGLADIEQGVRATPDTRYRIASMTKAITAALVLRVADRRLIDLDAPIQRYVKSYPMKRYPVTVRSLLLATSGVRGYADKEWLSTKHYPNLASALPIFDEDSLLYPSDSAYTETPYGFTLLGLAVEDVTHSSFEAALNTYVLQPAIMRSTVVDDQLKIVPHRARPYTLDSAGVVRNADYIDPSYKIPAGGLVSTASDVARFAIALLSGRLLKQSTLSLMISPLRLANGSVLPLGMGVARGASGGTFEAPIQALWFAGLQEGGTSVACTLSSEKVTVVLLTNVDVDGAGGFAFLKRLGNIAANVAEVVAARKGPATR